MKNNIKITVDIEEHILRLSTILYVYKFNGIGPVVCIGIKKPKKLLTMRKKLYRIFRRTDVRFHMYGFNMRGNMLDLLNVLKTIGNNTYASINNK